MHPYATNSNKRRTVMLALAIASIFLAYGLGTLTDKIQSTFQVSLWWLDTPAVLGFYGILHTMFDRCVWKFRFLHTLRLVTVPDLNGSWIGEALSSHQEFDTPNPVTIKIDQTWTQICIALRSDHSRSDSVVGAILFPKRDEIVLTYQYKNEPLMQAAGAMHAHRGTAWLCFRREAGADHLEGDYYSGRDRQNIGSNSRSNLRVALASPDGRPNCNMNCWLSG